MKTIDDLRSVLFETLEGLKNNTVDLEKAKAISEVGQTIINTAKVEVDYLKVTGERGQSQFIPLSDEGKTSTGRLTHRKNEDGTTSTIHKMR